MKKTCFICTEPWNILIKMTLKKIYLPQVVLIGSEAQQDNLIASQTKQRRVNDSNTTVLSHPAVLLIAVTSNNPNQVIM